MMALVLWSQRRPIEDIFAWWKKMIHHGNTENTEKIFS
jgi:hypothetical protein